MLLRAYCTTIGDQISYLIRELHVKKVSCMNTSMYFLTTLFVGTSRPDHASVFRTRAGTQEPIHSLRPIAQFFVDRCGGGLT
jgi:hypothetical protein